MAYTRIAIAFLCILIWASDTGLAGDNRNLDRSRKLPNIVLIVIDALRADHLSCLGYARQTTPFIDKVAAGGVLFRRCYSTSSWTLPACTSMMTGLYTGTHNVKYWNSVIPKNLTVLPEVLRNNGYYCAGVSSNPFLTSQHGFDRGFDVFDDTTVLAAAEWGFPLEKSKFRALVLASTGATATRRAMELLNDRPPDKPFFLFVHYMDCHADYVPPPPYDRKFDPEYKGKITGHVQSQRYETDMAKRDLQHVVALYDGEIAYTDKMVGNLLDHLAALGLEKNTCVILTADHGEEFLEHGGWLHGRTLFEEVILVPLIFRWPGRISSGRQINEPVSLVDIMPTVLGLLGIKSPQISQGINLQNLIAGQGYQEKRTIVVETDLGNPLKAIVRGQLKLICREGSEYESKKDAEPDKRMMIFDLAENPYENSKNTVRSSKLREDILLHYEKMSRHLKEASCELLETRKDSQMAPTEGHVKRLKSLGYIGD